METNVSNVQEIVSSVDAQRENAIASLRAEGERLQLERDSLIESSKNTLASINEAMKAVTLGLRELGVRRQRKNRGPGRPKGSKNKETVKREHNDVNLVDAIADCLSDGPKSIKDIVASVNYKSNSPNFESIVRQAFTRHTVAFNRKGLPRENKAGGRFVRIGRGVYASFNEGMNAELVKSMSEEWNKAHSVAE